MDTGVRLKENSKKLAQTVHGISHEHRLAIAYLLAHGDMQERDIVANIDLPQNLVAHHLNIMLGSGWVSKVKEGKFATYRLNPKALKTFDELFEGTVYDRNFEKKYR